MSEPHFSRLAGQLSDEIQRLEKSGASGITVRVHRDPHLELLRTAADRLEFLERRLQAAAAALRGL